MKEQKVYVAIVTYNRKEYLLNLLEALQQGQVDLQNCLNFRCRFPGIICG